MNRRTSRTRTPRACADTAHLLTSLVRDSGRVAIDATDTTALSYPEFLAYFRNAETLTRHHLIIGASFAYAWMPTILDFRSNRFELGVEYLERARAREELAIDQLSELAEIVNNSMVGASKLLHFAAPNHYAIWDSRVATYLGARVEGGVAGAEQYYGYNHCCCVLAITPEATAIATRLSEQARCTLSPMRAIEQVMWHASRDGFSFES